MFVEAGCAHVCTGMLLCLGTYLCLQLHAPRHVYTIHTFVCMQLPLGWVVFCALISPGYTDSHLPILPPDLTTGARWEDHGVFSLDSAELGAAPQPDQLVPGA